MSEDNKKLYFNLSLYVPKHDANFLNICREFVKLRYPKKSLSWFFINAVKDKINLLPIEDKRTFEDCAYKLAKKEKPRAAKFVDKFIKTGSV